MPDVPRRWPNAVEVVALSDHEWRVCDRHLDEHDGRRVLGYIEASEALYDVLELRPTPVRHDGCDTWEEAIALLAAHAQAHPESGPSPRSAERRVESSPVDTHRPRRAT